MKTTILYKVVYFDSNNDYQERDFETESDARTFAATQQDPTIFRYGILTECEEVP